MPADVLAAYGLVPEDDWRIDHVRTLNNTVFSVRHQSAPHPAWALRVHRTGWRDADAVRAELLTLEFLDQQLAAPIRVPRPHRTGSDDLLVAAAGSLYSLLGWLPGSPARPDTGLDAEAVGLLGRGLGAIHTALDSWRSRPPAPVQWDAQTLFGDQSPALMGTDPRRLHSVLAATDLEVFAHIAERTRQAFERIDDWGLIHADYILGNCHWASVGGQPQLAVLDFDDFGLGPRPFDLGAVLGNLADFQDSWRTNAEAFIAGYRTAHRLSDEAVAQLPLMMAARHASMCLWILGHGDGRHDPDRDHIRLRMQLARQCLAIPTTDFLAD